MKSLPEMVKHFEDYPNTLISKIYGLYKVKMKGMADIILCLQKNQLDCDPSNGMELVYDLKGSRANR